MWFWNPFEVFEKSSGELWNTAHRKSCVIESFNSFSFFHIFNLLLSYIVWFLISEVNVWVSLSTEEFCGKAFEEIFVSFLLRNWSFGENLNNENCYPFSLAVLNNEENIVRTISLNTFIVGDVWVSVSPIPGVFSVENCFSVNSCLMRGNVFGIGLFVLFEKIVALFDDQIFGQGYKVSGFLADLVSVFVEAEFVFIVGNENRNSLQNPAVVYLVLVKGNGRLLTGYEILIIEGC